MSSLKEIKNRIGSVKSTLKITSAMKLVASSKLHKAQMAIESMSPYQQALSDTLSRLSGGQVSFGAAVAHPILLFAVDSTPTWPGRRLRLSVKKGTWFFMR